MREVAGIAMEEQRHKSCAGLIHLPGMDTDVIARCQPNVNRAQFSLQVPCPFGIFVRKEYRSLSEPIEGRVSDRRDARIDDVPGDG